MKKAYLKELTSILAELKNKYYYSATESWENDSIECLYLDLEQLLPEINPKSKKSK